MTSASPSPHLARGKDMDRFPAHSRRAPATPAQERPPGTHSHAPVTSSFRIIFTEKRALAVSRVTSSSQATSMHKSLSLGVICPRLGGPPGMGRRAHFTLSFGTFSAAAHQSRTRPSSPGAP